MDDLHTGISGNLFKGTYKVGEIKHFCCVSDLHLLNNATNERRIRADLDEAMDLNARININGDVADLVLPKDFKRYMPSAIAMDGRGRDDLLNYTVDYVVDFLKPYAMNIDEIADGNHENLILKYHSIDFLQLVIDRLNEKDGVNIKHGMYSGFISYTYMQGILKAATIRFVIFRKHGRTKSAEVTHGLIEFNRNLVVTESMDIVWLAHSHDITHHSEVRMSVNNVGVPIFRDIHCIRTGGYMMHSKGSYQDKGGLIPKPHGGAMIHLTFKRESKKRIKVTQ